MVMSLASRRATSKWISSPGRLMAHYSREVDVMASSGEGPEPTPDVPTNYRPHFTNFLSNPMNQESADSVAFYTVKLMNGEMERNEVPMTLAHFEAATESLKSGDTRSLNCPERACSL